MPFAPACGINVVAHLGVEVEHGCIRAPWTAKKHLADHVGVGGELAAIDDKACVFLRIMLGLCCDKAALVRSAVNLAVIKDGFAIAEDEIDVAGDVAIGEILP